MNLPTIALCPPAWRMALVVCYEPEYPRAEDVEDSDPEPIWSWHPVVAVKSERWPDPARPDDWLERDDLMLWHENEGGVISVHEATHDTVLNKPRAYPSELVVCTWPPSEDEARFLEVARRLAEAMEVRRRNASATAPARSSMSARESDSSADSSH